MKSQTLPVKRRPVPQGIFRRLSAVTQSRGKKQRVAAAGTARDMDYEDGGSKISWALTIVLLIHVVAVALVLIHYNFINGRPVEQSRLPESKVPVLVVPPEEAQSPQVVDSQVSSADTRFVVRTGDTYASIAKAKEVSENDLRSHNKHKVLRNGSILDIPVKRVVVRTPAAAQEPASAAAAPVQTTAATDISVPMREEGLVQAIDVKNAPAAKIVNVDAVDGAKSYVVQSGDSVWGIAKKHGVDQDKLMQTNGITDVRKLNAGMKLKIP